MQEIIEPKWGSNEAILSSNPISKNTQNYDKRKIRFNSTGDYITYVRTLKINPHNSEYFLYMTNFINKHNRNKLSDSKKYLMITLLNKRLRSGDIRTENELIAAVSRQR